MTPAQNAAWLLSDDDIFDRPVPSASAIVAAEFLGELYRDVDGDDWLQVLHVGRNGGMVTDWFKPGQTVAMAERATRLPGSGVWVPVATRRERLGDGKRGSESDCAHLVAFVADLDVAGPGHAEVADRMPLIATISDARALLAEFRVPPTVIVDTGGGLQAWWVLNEPATVDDARPVAGRWEATWPELGRRHGRHIDNVGDIPRIMRLPGTLNRKPDRPAPAEVTIVHADWSRRYGLDDIDQSTIEPELPERPRSTERRQTTVDSPIGWYNQTHDIDDELRALGCVWLRDSRNEPQSHWFAPHHTADRARPGVSVYDDIDAVIWSGTFAAQLGVKERASLDAFSLYRHRVHGGNEHDAVKAAGEMMRKAERSTNDHDRQDGPPANVDPDTGEIIDDKPTVAQLPDEAYQRPLHALIRQHAHRHGDAADTVFGTVLARIAALTPHSVEVMTCRGPASLNFLAAFVGKSGDGKSTAVGNGTTLLPASVAPHIDLIDNVPGGSGEGLAEIYMGTVEVEDIDGKKHKERAQTRYAAFVYIDEGAFFTAMMERSGATLPEALRRAWTGGTLGQSNATADRTRVIPAGRYRLALVAGFQPELVEKLLDDAVAGTPQRFLFISANDAGIPTKRPPEPARFVWTQPSPAVLERHRGTSPNGYTRHYMTVDEAIDGEIWVEKVERASGRLVVDPLDSHGGLQRLKVAALLALLDGRMDVNLEDWRLATLIWDTSRAVRGQTIAAIRRQAKAKERAATERAVERDAHIERSREQRALDVMARAIGRHVHKHTDCTRTCVSASTSHKYRKMVTLDDAIGLAVSEGWIERTESGFTPGKSRPA